MSVSWSDVLFPSSESSLSFRIRIGCAGPRFPPTLPNKYCKSANKTKRGNERKREEKRETKIQTAQQHSLCFSIAPFSSHGLNHHLNQIQLNRTEYSNCLRPIDEWWNWIHFGITTPDLMAGILHWNRLDESDTKCGRLDQSKLRWNRFGWNMIDGDLNRCCVNDALERVINPRRLRLIRDGGITVPINLRHFPEPAPEFPFSIRIFFHFLLFPLPLGHFCCHAQNWLTVWVVGVCAGTYLADRWKTPPELHPHSAGKRACHFSSAF